MSYKTAFIARQKILDYLNAQPAPTGATEVQRATGLHKNIWCGCLKTMREHGEIEQVGKGRESRYRALAVMTITIEELKEHSSHAATVTLAEKPQPPSRGYVHKAGHFDNVPGHVPGAPLQNQCGQGSGARRVVIGSVLG